MESVIEEQVEPMDTSELLYSSTQGDIHTSHSLETCLEVPDRNSEHLVPMDDTPIEQTAPIVIDPRSDQPYQQEQPIITTTATTVVTDIATSITTTATNIIVANDPVTAATNNETPTLTNDETPVVATNMTPIVTTITKSNSATNATTMRTTREIIPPITIPTEITPLKATVQIASTLAAPSSTTTPIETEAVNTMATTIPTSITVSSSAVDSNAPPSVEIQDIILIEPPTSPTKETLELSEKTQSVERLIFTDSGIFEFMTPDRAIELYKIIALSGPPNLEWECYGKRKPREQEEQQDINESNASKDGEVEHPQEPVATGFDFDDEDFGDLETSLPNVSESLRLKKRDSGIERRTNLSDIMSDIMKESHTEDE